MSAEGQNQRGVATGMFSKTTPNQRKTVRTQGSFTSELREYLQELQGAKKGAAFDPGVRVYKHRPLYETDLQFSNQLVSALAGPTRQSPLIFPFLSGRKRESSNHDLRELDFLAFQIPQLIKSSAKVPRMIRIPYYFETLTSKSDTSKKYKVGYTDGEAKLYYDFSTVGDLKQWLCTGQAKGSTTFLPEGGPLGSLVLKHYRPTPQDQAQLPEDILRCQERLRIMAPTSIKETDEQEASQKGTEVAKEGYFDVGVSRLDDWQRFSDLFPEPTMTTGDVVFRPQLIIWQSCVDTKLTPFDTSPCSPTSAFSWQPSTLAPKGTPDIWTLMKCQAIRPVEYLVHAKEDKETMERCEKTWYWCNNVASSPLHASCQQHEVYECHATCVGEGGACQLELRQSTKRRRPNPEKDTLPTDDEWCWPRGWKRELRIAKHYAKQAAHKIIDFAHILIPFGIGHTIGMPENIYRFGKFVM